MRLLPSSITYQTGSKLWTKTNFNCRRWDYIVTNTKVEKNTATTTSTTTSTLECTLEMEMHIAGIHSDSSLSTLPWCPFDGTASCVCWLLESGSPWSPPRRRMYLGTKGTRRRMTRTREDQFTLPWKGETKYEALWTSSYREGVSQNARI